MMRYVQALCGFGEDLRVSDRILQILVLIAGVQAQSRAPFEREHFQLIHLHEAKSQIDPRFGRGCQGKPSPISITRASAPRPVVSVSKIRYPAGDITGSARLIARLTCCPFSQYSTTRLLNPIFPKVFKGHSHDLWKAPKR